MVKDARLFRGSLAHDGGVNENADYAATGETVEIQVLALDGDSNPMPNAELRIPFIFMVDPTPEDPFDADVVKPRSVRWPDADDVKFDETPDRGWPISYAYAKTNEHGYAEITVTATEHGDLFFYVEVREFDADENREMWRRRWGGTRRGVTFLPAERWPEIHNGITYDEYREQFPLLGEPWEKWYELLGPARHLRNNPLFRRLTANVDDGA